MLQKENFGAWKFINPSKKATNCELIVFWHNCGLFKRVDSIKLWYM